MSALILHSSEQQVLKRMLRVPHPLLQLEILNVIKSQVPFCGRKWRQCKRLFFRSVLLIIF
jgi:hypothetical protein